MEPNEVKIAKRGTTPEERQVLIQRWKESGKNKKDFCNEASINYCTFMSWIAPKKNNKSRHSKPQQYNKKFTEIKLPVKPSEVLFARISFGKSSLDLYQPVSSDFLLRILRA